MTARFKVDAENSPRVFAAMVELHKAVLSSGLEPSLYELVKIRASQINGCAFCIDMHTKDARAAGETEQRLHLLSVWREAPLYSEREQAALAWTEAVTKLDSQHVPEDVYARAHAAFGETELAALTLAVVEINGWNRFAIAFQYPADRHQPRTN